MSVSSPTTPIDFASRLEEGLSPTSTFDEKRMTRSNTIFSKGQSTIAAIGSRTASWAQTVGTAIKPNTSSSQAACKEQKLEDFPKGYPRVSYFLNSDESFMMYRRFGQLHSRLLLYKQDQIRRLEAELYELDLYDNELEETQEYLKCQEDDERREGVPEGCRRRGLIMADIEKKLVEYDQLLTQTEKLHSMNRPSDRDHKSVSNYFWNEQPLQEEDRDFLLHREDLVSVRPGREHAWLDDAVDTLLRWYPCRPVKFLFCDKESLSKTNDNSIHYFSRSRVNVFVTFIITTLILALLVVPIWILYWLTVVNQSQSNDTLTIAVLLLATLVFSCVLSLFTKAKRHEILAAAAGYCAVLVVFVGNIGNIGSGKGSN